MASVECAAVYCPVVTALAVEGSLLVDSTVTWASVECTVAYASVVFGLAVGGSLVVDSTVTLASVECAVVYAEVGSNPVAPVFPVVS